MMEEMKELMLHPEEEAVCSYSAKLGLGVSLFATDWISRGSLPPVGTCPLRSNRVHVYV